jgi:hypothetical protein
MDGTVRQELGPLEAFDLHYGMRDVEAILHAQDLGWNVTLAEIAITKLDTQTKLQTAV